MPKEPTYLVIEGIRYVVVIVRHITVWILIYITCAFMFMATQQGFRLMDKVWQGWQGWESIEIWPTQDNPERSLPRQPENEKVA